MLISSPRSGRRVAISLRAGVRGWRRFVVAAASVLLLGPSAALANSYKGLLSPGTLTLSSNNRSESGGFVYASRSWTAPAGVQFSGFAYTRGSFSSSSDNAVGGISAGFGGDGSVHEPAILFPWTDDCSITSGGHYWTRSSAGTVAGSKGQLSCDTAGNSSGWDYANAEISSAHPDADPLSGFHTLWLTMFCQAGTCNYDPQTHRGTGATSVTNLSGSFTDPRDQPSGSATWDSVVQADSWYQTNSGGLALNLSASDPAGVCAMRAALTGPATVSSGLVGHRQPSVSNVGAPIGQEFSTGTSPCWAGVDDTGTWKLPRKLADGVYAVNVFAANPGNYESQGFSAVHSPRVAAYSDAIKLDDSTPSARWADAPASWTAQTTEQLDVTAGPSGLSSVTCTDNGSNVPAALTSGSSAGAGTSVWTVPTAVTGANAVACRASNGDVNGLLVGSISHTFDVDATVPVVSFSDGGYTQGSWTNQAQTVAISASGGPSGIYHVTCSVDGGANTQLEDSSSGVAVVGDDGSHTVMCTATSNTGLEGHATYDVNIDTEQPTLSFLVNGSAPSDGYLSGTPVVTVIGGEAGGILSGLSQVDCTVNGGKPFGLSGIAPASDYTGSFELAQNGADHISCSGTTVAGTVQATPSDLTVNVDNPNYARDASTLIDDGADPFSRGPSQSHWYVTPQSVTITANNTGGNAPISAISCKGALSGTWPISRLNRDARGGERITLTVRAPGGDLSCAAEDSAGNVYVLGSYLFEIDDTAPTGYFIAKSSWPEPDAIELHVRDRGGSGVARVLVYGQSADADHGAPQLVGDARYDSSTHDYVVTIPDGVAPWVAGGWRFYANVSDVAGNQSQITAAADGSTEELTLPLREFTALSLISNRVWAARDRAVPGSLAAAAFEHRRRQGRPRRARQAHISASAASAARRRGPRLRRHALTVSYGRAITIRGELRDITHHGVPVADARVLIYQQLVGRRRYARVGSTRTNARGGYRYRIKPGASRTLYVVYPGDALLRPAASQLLERFAGSVTLAASTVQAGGSLVISGQVRGGHVPRGGLEVTIDYRQLGAPGSGTLGTVRTDRDGRYRFTQAFSASTSGLTYEVWAVVPGKQAGWPYLGATTARVIRQVG